VVLLSGITQAWICTIADQAGIYEKTPQGTPAAGHVHQDSEAVKLRSSMKFVDGILAQHAWVLLLLEAWQVLVISLSPLLLHHHHYILE